MYLYLWLKNWLAEQEGQDLIEYSLIIALIVLVAVVGMTAVGGQIQTIWETITTKLTAAAAS
jgi:Flp pilus assembly pilin Flp